MTFSPTRNSPTRSPHLEWRAVALVTACTLAAPAWAHDESRIVPEEPGWQLGAALGLADIHASQALPSQRMTGYLLRGDAGVDRRASNLEHGVIEAGWRLSNQWSAYAAAGKHDSDPAHTEAAWVRYEPHVADLSRYAVQAGRMRPQMGPVMTQAGHLDKFALMPLARRVALDGDWMDDGLQLSASREWGEWTGHADAGLWRGQKFPGSTSGSTAPSLHLGFERGDWRGDVFAVTFAPDGRGALSQSSIGGHTHHAPECSTLKTGVLCFAGRTNVVGSSMQWQSHEWPVTVQGAAWLRQDDGTLRSVNGQAQHQASYTGGWLQALWQVRPHWELGLRSERIQTRLTLDGAGASLLAQEAALLGSAPLSRNTAMLTWQLGPMALLSVESGRERQGDQLVSFTNLRAVFRTSTVLPGF